MATNTGDGYRNGDWVSIGGAADENGNLFNKARYDEVTQGLFLLSYPCVERFIASNFIKNAFEMHHRLGSDLKQFLHDKRINQSRINEETLIMAANEMVKALIHLDASDYDLDDFSEAGLKIFNTQEQALAHLGGYHLLSLLCMILMDLGLLIVDA